MADSRIRKWHASTVTMHLTKYVIRICNDTDKALVPSVTQQATLETLSGLGLLIFT